MHASCGHHTCQFRLIIIIIIIIIIVIIKILLPLTMCPPHHHVMPPAKAHGPWWALCAAFLLAHLVSEDRQWQWPWGSGSAGGKCCRQQAQIKAKSLQYLL